MARDLVEEHQSRPLSELAFLLVDAMISLQMNVATSQCFNPKQLGFMCPPFRQAFGTDSAQPVPFRSCLERAGT